MSKNPIVVEVSIKWHILADLVDRQAPLYGLIEVYWESASVGRHLFIRESSRKELYA